MIETSNGTLESPRSSRVLSLAKDYGLPLLVFLVGVCAASFNYRAFQENHAQLWTSLAHDRNVHYWLSLNFAIDLRHGDVPHLIKDFDTARVWPPLYYGLAGIAMAFGGLSDTVAILPNLLGWVLSAVFAFLLARRAVRHGGNWAGLLAATFVLVSPAHRAYSTDVMLECLGGCLTLFALYAFLVVVQEPSRRHGRLFGLAMTLLFFQKYNYWLLVTIAVSLWLALTYRSLVRQKILGFVQTFPLREWLIAQRRHPLNYIFVVLFIVVVLIATKSLMNKEILGWSFSLESPVNVVSVAFFVLVLRLLPWYIRTGRQLVQSLPDIPRQFIYWHAWPVFLWLLWPQRLWLFFWFLNPVQNTGERPSHDIQEGWLRYWSFLREDYHLSAWSLFIAAGLVVLAVIKWRKMRAGGWVLLAFLAISVFLTVHHPNRKSRFVHSWVAVGWVVAGAGMAELIYSRRRLGLRNARPWLAGAATAGLMAFHQSGTLQSGHAAEGGPNLDRANVLEITEEYRHYLVGMKHVAILSNLSSQHYRLWPVLESNGSRIESECDLDKFNPTTMGSEQLIDWLETKRIERIVFIQFDRGSPFDEDEPIPAMNRIFALLSEQTRLKCIHSKQLTHFHCTIKVFSPI